MRPLRTKAGPSVTASRVHCRLRCGVHCFELRRRGRRRAAAAVRGAGEIEQVRAFGVVELQGAGDRVEDAG
jgi:hypothetical protein